MAEEKERFQSWTGMRAQTAEQMMKAVANLSPWAMMGHATKHIAAVFTHTQKLSQAAGLHDRMKIHAEHAQMHIDLFQERAKELSEAMEVASNLVGAVASQFRLHKHLGEATKATQSKASDRKPHKPRSKSKS